MKIRTPHVCALALAAALGTSAVSASSLISTGNLVLDVESAVGSDGTINVSLEDGVATLTGNVENQRVAAAAEHAAERHPDVSEVIDLLSRG